MAAKGGKRNTLTFSSPADWWGAMWRDGLPTGNGTVGASVYGGAGDETILVNHSHLIWQGNAGVLPDVSDKLASTRKQIEFGDYGKAERILSDALITKGYRPMPALPLPLCDVKVHQEFDRPVKDYYRSVNMETAEVTVSYKDGMTRYERKLFVSRANDLLVYEISRMGPKNIDMRFSVDLHDRTNVRTPVSVSKLPELPASKYEKYFMYFAARNDTARDFGLVARISIFGGSSESDLHGVHVIGAEKVLIVMKPFVESTRDREWKELRTQLAANKLTYEKLLKEHAALHSKLFEATALDLGGDDDTDSMECELHHCAHDGDVSPALMAKLWAYGRYLFVCSTSENGRVMRPYGLWCGDYKAAEGYSNAAGTLQQLYAHAPCGGLADSLLPIFDEYETVLDELKKNATRLYNCRGILVPAVNAPGSGLLGSVDPAVVHTTWIAGSIGSLMYDYYLFTQDAKFLKTRALPFMREVALFYEEFFKVKMDGKFESSPSMSIGNTPLGATPDNRDLGVAKNSAIDFAVARDLLAALIAGAEEAKLYKNEIEKWKTMLTRVPNPVASDDGTVKEYLDERLFDRFDSGSVNMLYGVYPGHADAFRDPELYKAYLATARKREASGIRRHTAETLTRLAAIFARLGEGNDALDALETAVCAFAGGNGVLSKTAFNGMGVGEQDFWATYGLSGNLGLTAAVQEMLVQSEPERLRILPALPNDWTKGSYEGAATRFGGSVDLVWDVSRRMGTTVRIKSRKARSIEVVVPAGTPKIKGVKDYDPETHSFRLDLPAGKPVSIAF